MHKAKIVGETPERPPQLKNSGDTDQSAQSLVPSINLQVTV